MTGIGFYLLLLASAFFLTNSAQLSSEEIRIAVTIGIGFGQLTMTAVWLTFGHSSQKTRIGFVAVALEIMAVLFFTTFAVTNLPPSFGFVLVIACAVHFLVAWGAAKLFHKVSRVSLVNSDMNLSESVVRVQYRIRDLLTLMVVVAILAGLIKSKLSNFVAALKAVHVFTLIVCFYFFLSWPAIIACLSQRWKNFGCVAVFNTIVVFGSQEPVFSAIVGSFGAEPMLFFFCLDAPFVLSVVVHSLIARRFGYILRVAEKTA